MKVKIAKLKIERRKGFYGLQLGQFSGRFHDIPLQFAVEWKLSFNCVDSLTFAVVFVQWCFICKFSFQGQDQTKLINWMNFKINFTLHSSHSLQFLHETKWYDNTWCERPKVWGESWSYYLTIHFLKVIWNNWEYEVLAWNRMICRYLTQKVESWGKKRKLAGRPFCFSLSKLLQLVLLLLDLLQAIMSRIRIFGSRQF